MTKQVCISGYYGFDNYGDETILKILVENIKKYRSDISINVFSSNPKKTSTDLNVESTYTFDIQKVIKKICKSDCLVSGGGSLLQDVTSKKSLLYYLFIIFLARIFQKKVIIFAQGIGPIKDTLLAKITAILLKKIEYITIRDEKSLELLKSWGISAVLCDDPVWNIKLKTGEKYKKIGIQLRECSCLTDKFLLKLANEINKYYSDREIKVLSLQNSYDLKICEHFKAILIELNPTLKAEVIVNVSNDAITEEIASLDTLIAMRYHACLVGIKAGVKVFPLSYDSKVETLAKEFNLDYVALNTKDIPDDFLKEFVSGNLQYDLNKIKSKFFSFEEMLEKI